MKRGIATASIERELRSLIQLQRKNHPLLASAANANTASMAAVAKISGM
jgi:hypothetical protein